MEREGTKWVRQVPDAGETGNQAVEAARNTATVASGMTRQPLVLAELCEQQAGRFALRGTIGDPLGPLL